MCGWKNEQVNKLVIKTHMNYDMCSPSKILILYYIMHKCNYPLHAGILSICHPIIYLVP